MHTAELERLFISGLLQSAIIKPYLGKWVLSVIPLKGEVIMVSVRGNGEVREFTTEKAAINAASKIGFDSVTIAGLSNK